MNNSPVTLLDLTMVISLLPSIGTLIHHNRRVLLFILSRKQSQPVVEVLLAMSRQAPIIALIVATALWLRCTPCRAVVHEHWFIFYTTAGSIFVDLLVRLMITHVVAQEFWNTSFAVIYRILLFALPPLIFSLSPAFMMDGLFAPQVVKLLLLCSFLCSTLCLFGFIHQAIFEISDALDIDVFSIERQVARLNLKKNIASSTSQNMVVDPSSTIITKPTRRASLSSRQY